VDIRTTILAVILTGIFVSFGLAFSGTGFGDEGPAPVICVSEAARLVLAEYPGARIVELELDTNNGRLEYEIEVVTAGDRSERCMAMPRLAG
jgi:hypothetical protein